MNKKDWILAGIEFILWYKFIFIALYTIKHINEVNLYIIAGIELVIMYAASICCPLVRHSKPWRRLFHKEY